jgi:hypothetical protein
MMRHIEFTRVGDDGEETVVRLPAEWQICPNCYGEGTHVNRNIDGNGISPEEFAEDPDFAEAYFSGVYDVGCEECKREGKILAVVIPEDESLWSDDMRAYVEHQNDEADYRRTCAAERALGC